MAICDDIATAIQKADSSYFFEDYTKQALAVLRALDASGYAIVPRKATDAMAEAAIEGMKYGNMKPEDHVKHVYQVMVHASKQK